MTNPIGADRHTIERAAFLKLVATNPNYFGNLSDCPHPPVRRIVADTTYEQITAVGVHSTLRTFQVTVEVKRPTGYRGELLDAGSTEYLRLFADFGTGWEDLGATEFRVYDDHAPAEGAGPGEPEMGYVVSLVCEPRKLEHRSGTARVRAILSWEAAPPPGNANWRPVWGNIVDAQVWIAPRTGGAPDFTDLLGAPTDIPLEVYVEPRVVRWGRLPSRVLPDRLRADLASYAPPAQAAPLSAHAFAALFVSEIE